MIKRCFFIILIGLLGFSLSAGLYGKTNNPNRNHTVLSPDGKILLTVFHTEDMTWAKAQSTADMSIVAQWRVTDFRPHTIEFAPGDSSKLLMADDKKMFVYQLDGDVEEPIFQKQPGRGASLASAAFSPDGESVIWSTHDKVNRALVDSGIETKVASIPPDRGRIKSIIPLNQEQYVAILEDDRIIYIYSRTNTIYAKELKGHQMPVTGAYTPDGRTLFSLDERQELIIWDLNSFNIIKRLRLGKDLENPAKVEAVSLDEQKSGLLVKTQAEPDGSGSRYKISDLSKGVVNPSRVAVSTTDSGNVFATRALKAPDTRPGATDRYNGQSRSAVSSFDSEKQPQRNNRQNSYYDLAKIEADNENYEAALDFIKRVDQDDPDYRLSRELRKNVLEKIEDKNSLMGAVDQYKKGNYKSAKIILENILARNPNQKTAKRYLRLTEQKLSPAWLSVLGVIFLIILAIAAIVIAVRKWKPDLFAAVIPAKKKPAESEEVEPEKKEETPPEDKAYLQRKAFILKLNETRRFLKKAISLDRDGKYKDRWLEISSTLNDIENRAKKNDKYLSGLSRQLGKIQEKIFKFAPTLRPFTNSKDEKPASSSKALPGSDKEKKSKKSSTEQSKKKRNSIPTRSSG